MLVGSTLTSRIEGEHGESRDSHPSPKSSQRQLPPCFPDITFNNNGMHNSNTAHRDRKPVQLPQKTYPSARLGTELKQILKKPIGTTGRRQSHNVHRQNESMYGRKEKKVCVAGTTKPVRESQSKAMNGDLGHWEMPFASSSNFPDARFVGKDMDLCNAWQRMYRKMFNFARDYANQRGKGKSAARAIDERKISLWRRYTYKPQPNLHRGIIKAPSEPHKLGTDSIGTDSTPSFRKASRIKLDSDAFLHMQAGHTKQRTGEERFLVGAQPYILTKHDAILVRWLPREVWYVCMSTSRFFIIDKFVFGRTVNRWLSSCQQHRGYDHRTSRSLLGRKLLSKCWVGRTLMLAQISSGGRTAFSWKVALSLCLGIDRTLTFAWLTRMFVNLRLKSRRSIRTKSGGRQAYVRKTFGISRARNARASRATSDGRAIYSDFFPRQLDSKWWCGCCHEPLWVEIGTSSSGCCNSPFVKSLKLLPHGQVLRFAFVILLGSSFTFLRRAPTNTFGTRILYKRNWKLCKGGLIRRTPTRADCRCHHSRCSSSDLSKSRPSKYGDRPSRSCGSKHLQIPLDLFVPGASIYYWWGSSMQLGGRWSDTVHGHSGSMTRGPAWLYCLVGRYDVPDIWNATSNGHVAATWPVCLNDGPAFWQRRHFREDDINGIRKASFQGLAWPTFDIRIFPIVEYFTMPVFILEISDLTKPAKDKHCCTGYSAERRFGMRTRERDTLHA
ncbi:uncharacterized protein MYCFIDRAFT_206417 [Pseudocercospora fijiensis CIRAD86]|uniref:Uncharacterized protein n=1 Tax=Pseudocercospora fijiensis (strain CIRAD86) TaxID=383855 RepID=N1QD27_PSEFD|nr:uncharacterized protein MYCFIDRAFT_206417 [Pseudocercospora fijiensis CIRAD86]EME89653.1 hypothetical protein MYCFIDRAFT_206417 [Pseudocercospora fijiensis CIRAD86]